MRRRRYFRLRYRWAAWTLLVPGVVAAGAVATLIVLHHVALGTIVLAVAVLAFLTVTIRRPVPAGPRSGGDGPAPPGGAGVREPRRPRPVTPAGAAALPLPDDGDSTPARWSPPAASLEA